MACVKHTRGVYIEIEKAFDADNNDILLTKRIYYGIRRAANHSSFLIC